MQSRKCRELDAQLTKHVLSAISDAKLLEMRGSDGASHTLPSVFTANQEMLPRSAVVRRPFGNGTATLPLLSLAPVNVSAGAPICCLDPRRPISLVLAVTYR